MKSRGLVLGFHQLTNISFFLEVELKFFRYTILNATIGFKKRSIKLQFYAKIQRNFIYLYFTFFQCPVTMASLDPRFVYLVDTGKVLYIWVGKKSRGVTKTKSR